MTGRALYEKFCDSLKEIDDATWSGEKTDLPGLREQRVTGAVRWPTSWPYLTRHDQRVWNALARRITPKKRRTA